MACATAGGDAPGVPDAAVPPSDAPLRFIDAFVDLAPDAGLDAPFVEPIPDAAPFIDAFVVPLPDAHPPDAHPPDAMPPDAACTLSPNAGCGSGSVCDIDMNALMTGGTTCRPSGTGKETQADCVRDECAGGYTCYTASKQTVASCVAFCSVDSNCTAPGGFCVLELTYENASDQSEPVPGVKLCSQNCDPISATGCPMSWGCEIDLDATSGHYFTACTPVGLRTDPMSCTADSDCAVGLACVGATNQMMCKPRCIWHSPTACTTCTQLTTHPTIGGVEYGICFD